MLVVFEGLDNLGKTSSIRRVKEALEDIIQRAYKAETTVTAAIEPHRPEAPVHDDDDSEYPSVITAHEQYVRRLGLEGAPGNVVLSDRWVYSNEAYREVYVPELVQPDLIIYFYPHGVYRPEPQEETQKQYDALLRAATLTLGIAIDSPLTVKGTTLSKVGLEDDGRGLSRVHSFMHNERIRLSAILRRYDELLDRKGVEGVTIRKIASVNLKMRKSGIPAETVGEILTAIILHPKFEDSIRGQYKMTRIRG